MRFATLFAVALLLLALPLPAQSTTAPTPTTAPTEAGAGGVLPVGEDGKQINTDFETGDLRDWTQISGNAFTGQPIKGDAVRARRNDQSSRHQGNYWVGTYEVNEDGPRGIIQSKTFKVTHPWAKFLVGGGSNDESVDIV